MIRTTVFRNPLLKSALKKDVSTIKVVRCFTVVCKPNRKKLTYSDGERCSNGVESCRKSPLCRFYSTEYPAHEKVTLPALSPTMEFGTIISWEKKEGDKLNEGDLLAEIETDKAVMGFETPTEGYLAKIIVPAGTKNVPIGKLVCIIVEEENDVAVFKDFVDTESPKPAVAAASAAATPTPPPPSSPVRAAEPEKQPAASQTSPSSPASQALPSSSASPPPPQVTPAKSGERVYASPLAKKLAAEKGISLETIGKGSGIHGSITSQDLDKASVHATKASAGVPGEGFVDLPLANIRSNVAKRFLASKQTIPHYYLSVDVNADKVNALKEKFNAFLQKDDVKISLNNFIVKAVALSCKKVPEANSTWQETFIRQYSTVDVSIAVHTDQGLLTPIIFDADLKGLATISAETRALSAKAREGKLQPAECEGGTVAISDLSSFGVKSFTAIINPPHVCVLSIGATEEKLVEDKNNTNGFRRTEMLPVTLSCDHRVLDGAVGAKWLAVFRDYMENPETMML